MRDAPSALDVAQAGMSPVTLRPGGAAYITHKPPHAREKSTFARAERPGEIDAPASRAKSLPINAPEWKHVVLEDPRPPNQPQRLNNGSSAVIDPPPARTRRACARHAGRPRARAAGGAGGDGRRISYPAHSRPGARRSRARSRWIITGILVLRLGSGPSLAG